MFKRILAVLHSHCNHPGNEVVVDLLQGDVDGHPAPIMWCQICGAVNRSGKRGAKDWELARSPWVKWWRLPFVGRKVS